MGFVIKMQDKNYNFECNVLSRLSIDSKSEFYL